MFDIVERPVATRHSKDDFKLHAQMNQHLLKKYCKQLGFMSTTSMILCATFPCYLGLTTTAVAQTAKSLSGRYSMSAMFGSLSDHLDGTGIAGHLVVRGKQRDIFDLRLRYEYAVEGVFVNQRQRPDRERVFGSNL